jgi:hypothetical protein
LDTTVTVTAGDFPSRDNASEVWRDVSQAFLGAPEASLLGHSFTVGLPTALSVQFDVEVVHRVFVGALLTQRVPLLQRSLKRPNTLAVVPRFEHRWGSLSLPIVLNDWQSLRLGMAARLGWLYLGTDNMGSYVKKKKLTGGDVYIGLKINAFSMGLRRRGSVSGGHSTRSGRNLRKIKCYEF